MSVNADTKNFGKRNEYSKTSTRLPCEPRSIRCTGTLLVRRKVHQMQGCGIDLPSERLPIQLSSESRICIFYSRVACLGVSTRCVHPDSITGTLGAKRHLIVCSSFDVRTYSNQMIPCRCFVFYQSTHLFMYRRIRSGARRRPSESIMTEVAESRSVASVVYTATTVAACAASCAFVSSVLSSSRCRRRRRCCRRPLLVYRFRKSKS